MKPGDYIDCDGRPCIVLPCDDYRRLLDAAAEDDAIEHCQICGAWIDIDDPACAHVDDFRGCWKIATGREQDTHLCRSYRALEMPSSERSERSS